MSTFNPAILIVRAGVRYWEDATVNGVEDADGELIPLKIDECWCPTIDLATGRIHWWPIGTTASIHYKVCDAGEYWVKDDNGTKWKYRDDYVPGFLAVGDEGYGDYIIMKVNEAGFIQGWKKPRLDPNEWELA